MNFIHHKLCTHSRLINFCLNQQNFQSNNTIDIQDISNQSDIIKINNNSILNSLVKKAPSFINLTDKIIISNIHSILNEIESKIEIEKDYRYYLFLSPKNNYDAQIRTLDVYNSFFKILNQSNKIKLSLNLSDSQYELELLGLNNYLKVEDSSSISKRILNILHSLEQVDQQIMSKDTKFLVSNEVKWIDLLIFQDLNESIDMIESMDTLQKQYEIPKLIYSKEQIKQMMNEELLQKSL